MPWWMKIYIGCYFIVLILNIAMWIKNRGKFIILIYELLAGLYMIGLAFAYWNTAFFKILNIGCVPAVFMIFVFDIYISITAKKEDFGIFDDEFSEADIELAKLTSIVFTSPAYVVSGLTSFQLIKTSLA